jgi:MFS family permease
MNQLIRAQSIFIFGTGMIFPFYLIFLNDVGGNFTSFGLAYGLFSISTATIQYWVGKSMDRNGVKSYLIWSSWGTAFVLLLLPIISHIYFLYVVQILMGAFTAIQRLGERVYSTDHSETGKIGEGIGRYQFWISISSGFAVIIGGWLAELFTIDLIFYIGAVILFISGCFFTRLIETNRSN